MRARRLHGGQTELRTEAVDPRPALHITPEHGWLNDPNGLVRHGGRYHVFHQANADAPDWGRPHWDHVSSLDLLSWQREPTALAPSPGADDRGVWSGCVVIDGSTPTAVYTGVHEVQTVCVAVGDDDLVRWEKDASNPVVTGVPGFETLGFRDPWVWPEPGGWAMLVGTGVAGVGGALALYRSSDLRAWRYEGFALDGAALARFGVATGRLWECPHLARVADRDVLVLSVWDDTVPTGRDYADGALHHPLVVEGTFDGRLFQPSSVRRLDQGPDIYAPAFLRDGGRTLLIGWSWEALSAEARRRQGWAGVLTFPRELAVEGDRVVQRPAAELGRLRTGAPARASRVRVESHSIEVGRGEAVDVEAVLVNRDASAYGVEVLASDDGRETTRIVHEVMAGRLVIDRTRSSLLDGAARDRWVGALRLEPGEPLRLRVLVDHSIVEVFANGGFAATVRVYPSLPSSRRVTVFADGGSIEATDVATWQLAVSS